MKRRTIRVIILLSAILLIGLVATQIFWVGKAYELQEKQFTYDITYALKNVASQILLHNNDSAQLIDPVKQISPNAFRVSINDTLHPYYLESMLKSEFRQREINIDFEYSIYDCFTDSVVYTSFASTKELSVQSDKITQTPIKWEKDGHYFGVYFPDITPHIFSQMGFWLISSGILLVVVIFFAYTISIILRQKRLSEITTDFINNMTHELKTPISTISLSAEMLLNEKEKKEPEKLKNYASIIQKENNRLKKQVERVLQIATLEREEIRLQKKQVDLHEIIENTVEGFKLGIAEKNGEIATNMNAENSVVSCDEVHVTNILNNLLDNAIKYSNKNPKISISTKNTKNGIVIAVKDNGIGISKQHQKYVFDKFFRVPTGDVHNVKGFGLGLNYVKAMAEAHRGYIILESKIETGSKFEVFLPF